MKSKPRILLFIVLVAFSAVKAQKIGVGADAIYNFQAEGFGAGARVSIFPNNRLSFVPQFSYFFPFNKVNEYYAGLALEYKIIKRKKINFYLIAHGAYNSWLNYEVSPLDNAKKNNWNLEGGAGISNNWCLRPFLEYRYNVKFRETNLHFGFLYIFGCREARKGDRATRCAAYDS